MILGYVLVTVEVEDKRKVISVLEKIHGVTEIYPVHGVYDIILRVEAETQHELDNVIKSGIRQIEKINSTLTMIARPK